MKKLICLALLCASAWAQIDVMTTRRRAVAAPAGLVQSCTGYQAWGTSMTCEFGSQMAAGDIIIIGTLVPTAATISDTCNTGGTSSTYTAQTAGANYSAVAGKSGACTVTISWTGAANTGAVAAQVNGYSSVDKNSTNTQYSPGTGTDAVTSSSVTTDTNGEFIWAWSLNRSGGGGTLSAGTSYSLSGQATDGTINATGEYRVQATAGAVTGTFTISTGSGSDTRQNGIITLRP